MDDLILVLDIGTSSVKAGLLSRGDASPAWLHREPIPTSDEPSGPWVSERWVQAVQATIDQLPPRSAPQAIALSGNGPTVIPVGADGAPIGETLLWYDRREERITGQPSFFLPKVRWLATHERRLYDQTRWFMTCPEYISFLLGADPHTTSPDERFDPYVWNGEGIDAYDLDAARLPPVARPGTAVGRTGPRARELFGLPVGLPVFAGGPDFLMSLLGTAAVVPGTTCDRAGTSEGINHCASDPVTTPDVRCLPHVVPGLWNIAGVLSSTGRIFEWFRSISRQQSVGYERMLAEIDESGMDEEPLFFPSMHRGAAWEFSRGMFVGLRADHSTADMGRAVVHSIGYAVRQSIEWLGRAGCTIRELRACGGQAKNSVWNRMKADITGVPVRCPLVLDAELVGDLCCAIVGLGDDPDLSRASGRLVRFAEPFEPDPRRHERFSANYGRYIDVYGRYLDALHSSGFE